MLRGGGFEATQWEGPVLSLDPGPVRRLGPDVMDEGFDPLRTALSVRARGTRPLGEVLLDQRVVAGIGNMWLSEALWQARLSPWRAAGETEPSAPTEALAWVSGAMRAAVAGRAGARAVYRRAARPCPRCGTAISSLGLGAMNRTAYWCPGCQP